MADQRTQYDYLVVGAGFAGSITALCLNSAGYSVCLVEKDTHPRFSIGESSTPVADMILRDLADRYDLPSLKQLSRYGTWQAHFPNVTCGIKRGFSYYKHEAHTPFNSDNDHSRELLVAASMDNDNSDTQWYRPDTDALFAQMVQEAGIDYLDQTAIETIVREDSEIWTISANHQNSIIKLSTDFIIDATGSSAFSSRFFGTKSSAEGFYTNSSAIYSHFDGVPYWKSYLDSNNFFTKDYPYHPDHSALHHLLDEGWLWMLRFNNNRLSAGLVIDRNGKSHDGGQSQWKKIISKYPSLKALFEGAGIPDLPGQIIQTDRLQRRLDKIYGPGWAALHHTAGFVDPLHSTGIAHSMAGVEKLVSILTKTATNSKQRMTLLENYQKSFFNELAHIDQLVAGCYLGRHHFELFTAFTMLYFVSTIHYEQQRLAGHVPDHFLSANHPDISRLTHTLYSRLKELVDGERKASSEEIKAFVNHIREKIQPFNSVGLMDPSKKNMYEHTAVTL